MKKILALALAVMMVMGLAISVSAEDTTYSVTINNAAGHTYTIYQIFTGELSVNKDGKEVLANLKYGTDYTPGDVTVGDLVPVEVLDTLAATATTIKPDGDGTPMVVADGVATATGLAAGYYMVKDTTQTLPEGDKASAVIFQVVGNTTITSKHTGTTIVKKVKDTNDSVANSTTDWQDSADYDIGDKVPFQSTSKFEGMDNYDSYKVVFTDIMSKGLDYNEDMKVFVNGKDCTKDFSITHTTYTGNDEYNGGTQITVSCDNIKPLANANAATIVLEYSANLVDGANLGAPGNPNKINVHVIPNNEGEGETTPWDVNIVFTYKVLVNKVDENDQLLSGAEFTLEKYEVATNSWKPIAKVAGTADTLFAFEGLDDGDYRITETKTPVGYNSIKPIYFTVTAEHEIQSENPALTSLTATQSEADKETGSIAEFTADLTKGTVSTDVENKPGVVLPETGGIGTTIFYALGGVLVLVAVVLLVTKKRMATAE